MTNCARCGMWLQDDADRDVCRRCVDLEAGAVYFTNEPEQKWSLRKCKLCDGGPAFVSGVNEGFCQDCVEKVIEQVASNKMEVPKRDDRSRRRRVAEPRDEGPGQRCDCRHLRSNHTSGGCVIYLEDASGWCPCALTPSAFVIGGRGEGKSMEAASWERMTFGRYDGWAVGDLPKSYLLWAARLAESNELVTASPALRAALVTEAKRKGLDLSPASWRKIVLEGPLSVGPVEPQEATPRRPARLIGGEV